MSNKRLGLALGAGSAKGLAHLGVLQVLEENNIEIACIAGTSMGAVLGGIYASGTDLNLLCKFAGEFSEKPFLDISVPRRGLVRGERFQQLIKMLTKDYDFTQLRIPFAAVACDLKRGATVTFKEGGTKLHDAIRASIAIPGVFHPYNIDGVDYVDGGVIDRVPVQTARDLGADVVLAVDVGYKGGGERPMGNIMQVLMSAFDVMGWEIAKHKVNTADLLISPDVSFVNRMTTSQASETIQAGRDVMEANVDRLKSLIAPTPV